VKIENVILVNQMISSIRVFQNSADNTLISNNSVSLDAQTFYIK